jgi:tetratricopeptide (TPR) repeat protein
MMLTPGSAQDNRLVSDIRETYMNMDYSAAEKKAVAALANYQNLKPYELVEIHQILAIIYFSQNRVEEARQAFRNALSLDPDMQLDPVMVSPKIVDFFKDVSSDYFNATEKQTDDKVRYVKVYDPRPTATLRSMLVPGWGQIYKGQKKKGLILMGMWGIGLAGTVVVSLARASAQDRYLTATESGDIESNYSDFNRWHKLRNGFIIFGAGVWVFSFFDALISQPRIKGLTVVPDVSESHLRVHFNLSIR